MTSKGKNHALPIHCMKALRGVEV